MLGQVWIPLGLGGACLDYGCFGMLAVGVRDAGSQVGRGVPHLPDSTSLVCGMQMASHLEGLAQVPPAGGDWY